VNTNIDKVQAEAGMELRDLLTDPGFPLRKKQQRDLKREADSFRRLAAVFAGSSNVILQELVNIAVDLCGANSAGISLEEADEAGELRFRWVAVAGSFATFVNGTTPRFFSPCGTCINRRTPQLYKVTKPYYDYLGIEAEPITDGILIPWMVGDARGTLWAVAHDSEEAFDIEDYLLLKSISDFAAVAIRHQLQQEVLRKQEKMTAAISMANDLAHQINNPLQSLTNVIYLAERGSQDIQPLLRQASAELDCLSDLVRRLLTLKNTVTGDVR
jgi:hypothetical protein